MRFLLILMLFFSSVSYSKTLIVSDIDDTIKASHVRNKIDSVSNAFVTTLAFKGMKEVYEEVLRNSDAEVIYVTNALDITMHNSHTEFIQKNHFPEGKIFFRTGSADTHKYNTIKKYLLDNPSIDRLVLVGDNGERDIKFYNQVAQEFKKFLDIHTYIHIIYAEPTKTLPLEENQKGFVSPLELLTDLSLNGFVPMDRYFEREEALAVDIVQADKVSTKEPLYFPQWLNCKGFEAPIYPLLMTPVIEKGYEKVRSICQ